MTDKERYLKAAKLLKRALNLMNDNGSHWIKGVLKHENNAGEKLYCAVGGVNAAARRPQRYVARKNTIIGEAFEALGGTVSFDNFVETSNIVRKNDSPSMTWKKMQTWFNGAIKKLEKKAEAEDK